MTHINSKTGIILINETSFIINEGLTFLGRDPASCSIILTNATISKQHALFIKIKDSYYISDLQSTNGTKLEQVSLTPRFCYEITNNANISIGEVNCKFIIQEYNAIFKTPAAPKKRSLVPAASLDSTAIIQTNIHDLPTQLDEYELSTQSCSNTSNVTANTQLLESSIIESPIDSSRMSRPTISKQKQQKHVSVENDDFVIPETQSENVCLHAEKQFEIDESNLSDQLELSKLEISDTQLVELHNSFVDTPRSIHNMETQLILSPSHKTPLSVKNIHEATTQLFDFSKSSTPKNNLTNKNFNLENISLLKPETPGVSKGFKTSYLSINDTQLFEQETILNPTTPSSSTLNIHETDTQLFENKPNEVNRTPSPSIHETETQLFENKPNEVNTPPSASIHEAETQLFEDNVNEVIKNKGEPINHSDGELEETQFEFDAEPNIESPKLNKLPANDETKVEPNLKFTESLNEISVKRVIGRNRPINFTQDYSQNTITESQSEPGISSMKRVIGNQKPINFTPTPDSPNEEIDMNETQFDEELNFVDNTSAIAQSNDSSLEARSSNTDANNITPKITPNCSAHTFDSDISLNHSVKTNIRDIILTFEAASKNNSNSSTPNRSVSIDSPSKFDPDKMLFSIKDATRNKISKSVETDVCENQIQDENVEIQTSSATNCLNDKISNSSVQHVCYSKEKTKMNELENQSEQNEIFDIPTQKVDLQTNNFDKNIIVENSDVFKKPMLQKDGSIDNEIFSTPTQLSDRSNSSKTDLRVRIQDDSTTDDDIFELATQVMNSPVAISEGKSNCDQEVFKMPTQRLRVSNHELREKSNVDTRNTLDVFDIPTQILPTENESASNNSEKPNIFDIPTQIQRIESLGNISKTSKESKNNVSELKNVKDDNEDIFDIPTQKPNSLISKNSAKSIENMEGVTKNLLRDDDLEDLLKDELVYKKNGFEIQKVELENERNKIVQKDETEKNIESFASTSTSTEEIIKNSRPKRQSRKTVALEDYLTTKQNTRRSNREKVDKKVSNAKKSSSSLDSTYSSTSSIQSSSSIQSNSTRNSECDSSSEKRTRKKGNKAESLSSIKDKHANLEENSNLNTEVKGSSSRVDEMPSRSSVSTRTRKRKEVATETSPERKVKKIVNEKETLLEKNNNLKNKKEKLLFNKNELQAPIQKTKLCDGKTVTQTSTPSSEVSTKSGASRSTRKSKIPLKVESPSDGLESTDSTRKRNHQSVADSLSLECASPAKILREDVSSKFTKEKYRVMFTIFRDEEQEKIVKKLGGKVVDKSKDANVLVTNQIKRSVKLLNAISQGIPIVSPRWLDVCGNLKTFVDPWKYLLNDVEAEKKFKFKLRESLNTSKNNGLLLEGYTAMITKTVPTDLKDILENGGAKYITTWPKIPTDKHFIVSTVTDKSHWSKFTKTKTLIVSPEAIFSSVIRQKLDLKSFSLL